MEEEKEIIAEPVAEIIKLGDITIQSYRHDIHVLSDLLFSLLKKKKVREYLEVFKGKKMIGGAIG